MNEELELKLYKEDPVFFEEALKCLSGEMNECNSCMAFGCECGDGWFNSLLKLTRKMFLINSLAKKYHLKVICNQLKEKFGELHCYYSVQNTMIHDTNNPYIEVIKEMAREAVRACETDCWNVCEWCGADGGYNGKNLITTSGWVSRICKKCAQEKYDKDVELYDQNNPNNSYVNIPRITLFKEGYGFLNFFDASIFEYDGVYYNSIPHALYSIKDPKHKDLYAFVRQNCKEQSAPYVISELARAFGIECSDNDYNLLKDIVLAKYTYKHDIGYKTDLLNTEDKKLINMNKYCDNLWGVCVCEKCNQSLGKNLYGQILMEVREQLKNN